MIKRGDIYYANLSPVIGSEQGGIRPVAVIQNDIGNIKSNTVIVAAITSSTKKHTIPTHVAIENLPENGLQKDSIALLEQVRTIDRERLVNFVGVLSENDIKKVNKALKISFGL